jgi:hypothetical protein
MRLNATKREGRRVSRRLARKEAREPLAISAEIRDEGMRVEQYAPSKAKQGFALRRLVFVRESGQERIGALQRLVDTLTCSNPEPLASIKVPLGPLDLAWYMLAEAEISSERDVSIVKSLHSKLKDGPILFMELMLRNRWITIDVLNSDSAGFARHLLDYLAGVAKFGFGGALLLDLLGPPGRCSGCWPHDGEVAGGAVADSTLVISGSGRW